jgi:hypothetical protein
VPGQAVEGAIFQVVRPETLDVERRGPNGSVGLGDLKRVDLREDLAHQSNRQGGGLLDGGPSRHRQASPRAEAGEMPLERCFRLGAEGL